MSKKLFATLAATLLLSSQAAFADQQVENLDPSSIITSANEFYNNSKIADAIKLYKEVVDSQNSTKLQKVQCLGEMAGVYFELQDFSECMKTYTKALNLCDEIINKEPTNANAYVQKSKILRNLSNILRRLESDESYLNESIKTCDEGLSHSTSDAAKGALLREKGKTNLQSASNNSLISANENITSASLLSPDQFDSVLLINVFKIRAERALKQSPFKARKIAEIAQKYTEQSSNLQFENPFYTCKQASYINHAAYLFSLLKQNSLSGKYFEIAQNKVNAGLSKYPNSFDLNLVKACLFNYMVKSEANSKKVDLKKIEQLFTLQNESFEKALSLRPDSIEATYPYSLCLLNQAQFYKKQKNFKLAKKFFNKSLSMTQAYATGIKKSSKLADAVTYIVYLETKNKIGFEGILSQYPKRGPLNPYKENRFQLTLQTIYSPPPKLFRTYKIVPGGIILKKDGTKFGYQYMRITSLGGERKRFLNLTEYIKKYWLPFSTI